MNAKRIMSFALACVLAVTATACGAGPSGGDSTPTASSGTSSGSESNMNAEGLPILKEPETFKVLAKRDPLSMKNMDEKECVIQSEKDTNIHVEWQEVPANGWEEKVNVILASNELPDVICGGVNVMQNYRALTPLNDLIDQYAPNIQDMFERTPGLKEALTAPDGNIYALPTGGVAPTDDLSGVMWINKDWLEKLNLEVPTTIDEMYDVMVAFRDQDPNGNGKKDEIPLAASANAWGCRLDSMFGLFGTFDIAKGDNSYTRAVDGKIIFAPREDAYFDALQWFHKLYAEGLLNQDYFTENAEQFAAKGQGDAPRAGIILCYLPDIHMTPEFAESYVPLPPVKGPNGDPIWFANSPVRGIMGGFAVTKQCKHPEVMVRWYDYCNSSLDMVNLWSNGPEGKTWEKNAEGLWKPKSDALPEGMNYEQYRKTEAAFDINAYFYSYYMMQQEFTDPRVVSKLAANDVFKPFVPKELYNQEGLDLPENLEKRSLLLTDIQNYMDAFKAEAIINGIDEAQWQEHLDHLDALKVDEYLALHQDFYDRVK